MDRASGEAWHVPLVIADRCVDSGPAWTVTAREPGPRDVAVGRRLIMAGDSK